MTETILKLIEFLDAPGEPCPVCGRSVQRGARGPVMLHGGWDGVSPFTPCAGVGKPR